MTVHFLHTDKPSMKLNPTRQRRRGRELDMRNALDQDVVSTIVIRTMSMHVVQVNFWCRKAYRYCKITIYLLIWGTAETANLKATTEQLRHSDSRLMHFNEKAIFLI